jgi:alkylhydroperoxidase/carboxymuconolactone decarboxylase family protein YurZ
MDLAIKNNDCLSKVLSSRGNTFHTITKEKLEDISKGMVEIDRSMRSFGKRNTQTVAKLMTLTMLSPCSPYHTLRQILTQIDKKRDALKETAFKLRRKELRIKQNKEKLSDTSISEIDKELLELSIMENQVRVNEASLHIEGALKEIGMYQQTYREICESHNIPEKWDEKDMEEAEIAHHIRAAFRNCIRDLMATGRMNHGTMEYMEQYGINPVHAHKITQAYIDKNPTTHMDMYVFLDACVDMFQDAYKGVMERLGIKTLIDEQWLYRENT